MVIDFFGNDQSDFFATFLQASGFRRNCLTKIACSCSNFSSKIQRINQVIRTLVFIKFYFEAIHAQVEANTSKAEKALADLFVSHNPKKTLQEAG